MFDVTSLNAVSDTLTCIEENTGLLVNYDKTSIYRIGSIADSHAMLCTTKNFKWTNEPTTVLGVNITHESNKLLDINYATVTGKMESVVSLWQNRS